MTEEVRGRWDRPLGVNRHGVPMSALAPRLTYCHSRREFDSRADTFFCAHPKMHADRGLVTAEVCQVCPYWRDPPPNQQRPYVAMSGARRDGLCMFLGEQIDLRQCGGCRGNIQIKVFDCGHPLHEETTLQNCSTCLHFEERLQVELVRHWTLGVTTAPRRHPTLERCITSLQHAGWDSVRIFAEPGVELPVNAKGLPVTWRESTVGPWPNWYLSLTELYLREPRADAYFLVQDDTIFCRNLRRMLEKTLWPAEKLGLVSVFCPAPYAHGERGFRRVNSSLGLFGAQTYIFPNAAARLLLSHPEVIAHRLRGDTDGVALIDVVVGEWASKERLPVYYHSPSLAQHIGDTTTIWGDAQLRGRRTSRDFVGESFDAVTFLADEDAKIKAAQEPPQ